MQNWGGEARPGQARPEWGARVDLAESAPAPCAPLAARRVISRLGGEAAVQTWRPAGALPCPWGGALEWGLLAVLGQREWELASCGA